MTNGTPEIDPHGSDIARFYEHHRTAAHVEARSAEGFNKTYGIVHPMEQWASNRDVRLSPGQRPPARARRRVLRGGRLGAAVLVRRQRARCSPSTATGSCRARPSGTSRWWSPIINAEHLAMRDRVGHGRPVGVRDLRRHRARRLRLPPGPRASTRWTCPSAGRSTRRSSTGPAGSWPTSRSCASATTTSGSSPAAAWGCATRSGSPTICRPTARPSSTTRTSALDDGRGLWGPRARDLVAVGDRTPTSPRRLPVRHGRRPSISAASGRWRRGSRYVGELGWEIYVPMEQGLRALGRPLGGRPGRTAWSRSGSASTR